jgi:hypothetical protein
MSGYGPGDFMWLEAIMSGTVPARLSPLSAASRAPLISGGRCGELTIPGGPRYRVKIVKHQGEDPVWEDVDGDDRAVELTDQLVFWDWVSLDFFQEGHIVTVVRPGTDGTPVIMAMLQGERGTDGGEDPRPA